MGFSFVRIFAVLELTENVPDPYLLFGVRTGWQDAFRHAVSCNLGCCESCATADCPGFLAFSQALTPDPAALRRYQKPSPPFVFQIPILPEVPNKNTCCTVGLTLVGNAVHYTSMYLDALGLLFDSRKLPLRVVKFQAGGYGTERFDIDSKNLDRNIVILSDDGVIHSKLLSHFAVTINFSTPVRLLRDGKPLRLLPPALLLRSLMRRVSSLAYYYGGCELDVDFKWLSKQSTTILYKDSTLTWIDRGKTISGLLGKMTLVGDITDFHYFLAMGEYFNIGKGAAFGLGKYVLRNLSEPEIGV